MRTREIALLTNPTAGQGKRRPLPRGRPAAAARQRAWSCATSRAATPTRRATWPGPASPTASRPSSSAAATGSCTSPPRSLAGTGIPLGIIPAGTGNDVARYFDLPRKDPVAAADRVIAPAHPHHRPGPQRLALLRHRARRRLRRDRQRARQRDDVAARPDALQPRHPRRAAHLPAAALHARPRRRHRCRVDAMLVAVGNGTSYGGGLRITEGALLDDGLLDVVIIKKMTRSQADPHLSQALLRHAHAGSRSTSTTASAGSRSPRPASCRTPTASASASCR